MRGEHQIRCWCSEPPAGPPHVRGEHHHRRNGFAQWIGPSPRAWGARCRCCPDRRARWTIPTCVGSTTPGSPTPGNPSDHPHVRGEHLAPMRRWRILPGPSPRAWGARRGRRPRIPARRTIPTCVGSTASASPAPGPAADHPHVRGEHGFRRGGVLPGYGPSPRAWGALRNSGLWRMPNGPSPRAWGAPRCAPTVRFPPRTIPTCVGSTEQYEGRTRRRSDHPHVRGEHDGRLVRTWLPDGPSPRAWGALH